MCTFSDILYLIRTPNYKMTTPFISQMHYKHVTVFPLQRIFHKCSHFTPITLNLLWTWEKKEIWQLAKANQPNQTLADPLQRPTLKCFFSSQLRSKIQHTPGALYCKLVPSFHLALHNSTHLLFYILKKNECQPAVEWKLCLFKT